MIKVLRIRKYEKDGWCEGHFVMFKEIKMTIGTNIKYRRYGVIIYDNGDIRQKYSMGQNGHHQESKKLFNELKPMSKKERLNYIKTLQVVEKFNL